MAVIRVVRQRLGVGGELAAPGATEGGGERDLDAELVGAMGLAFHLEANVDEHAESHV